jgi:uncharacterized protein YecE (DUF72 family)
VRAVKLVAGTSGWSYAPWKGSFYPAKLPTAQMLRYYASRLPTVELNNTFYRMPGEDQIRRWAEETPPEFSFAAKAPRRITHERKLEDVDDSLERAAKSLAAFGERLGPMLVQLPPFLKKDAGRLRAFLDAAGRLAPNLRLAFEFRHASWFDDEIYAALGDAKAALCIAEGDALETPLVATTAWGYLRLRREHYDDAAIDAWTDRIATQRWTTVHVFFKHEDAGVGPRLAAGMLERAHRRGWAPAPGDNVG